MLDTYNTLDELSNLYQKQIENTEKRFQVSKAWAEDLENTEHSNKMTQLEVEQNDLIRQVKELEDKLFNR
jgi:hypothetical protein